MIDISIIIVNYKSWITLRDCLEALINIESDKFSMEIIVVDNCSNDDKLIGFKKEFPKINFIENTGNNGFANGCNTGANVANGDYLLFLNPDTVANENAIFELWQTATNNPNYGIVTCTQIDDNGKKYNEIRFFPNLKTLFGIFRATNKYFNKSKIATNFDSNKLIIFPDWATGAVIFMSKKWFEKVNGWNEKYWLYFEDIDICKKINSAGGKVALIRTVSILHKHGGASRINIKTKALTKTEVIISKHVYFSNNFEGFERFIIQFLLVFTTIFEKTILTLFGLILFFIPKMKVNILIFRNIITYYFSALANKTWTSPRATIYKKPK